MFLWPGLETRGDAASASDQWDNVMPHDRSFFSGILICIMIFMKIISWKSEKENHNLKQRKISNQSLTMWNEHFRILNETCKKKGKQNLTRQNGKYSARNYVLESICTSPYQLCTSGRSVPIRALFFFILPNCSNSISTTVLHANRRKHNGDKLNLKKTNLTNNRSKHHVLVWGLNWLMAMTDPWTTQDHVCRTW